MRRHSYCGYRRADGSVCWAHTRTGRCRQHKPRVCVVGSCEVPVLGGGRYCVEHAEEAVVVRGE